MSMDFEDYIANYPLPDDPSIQSDITNREEFHELRAVPNEQQQPGKFFKHQLIFARYMRYYDRVFNIHETGTGKTGSIIATAEMFRRLDLGIQRTVILFPGELTMQDFRLQLVKFFPEKYDADDEKVRNKKIEKWYELKTYGIFASDIRKLNQRELKDRYSHTLFFLDEIHNLRNYTDRQESDTYEAIWSLLHLAEYTKIALGSATPMVNETADFIPLMNLILPADRQLSVENDLSTIPPENLEAVLRGKISFVRSSRNKIVISEMGNSLQRRVTITESKESRIKFVTRRFNEYLRLGAEESQGDDDAEQDEQPMTRTATSDTNITLLKTQGLQEQVCIDTFKNSEQSSNFSIKERAASTFVFPDGSVGTKGYKKYQNDLTSILGNGTDKQKLENLKNLSVKFHFYITNELNNTGNTFCYIEDVRGGGMYLLAAILEQFGFQRFENMSVISDSGEVEIRPKKRYALLTSDGQTNHILELFNSKQNKNGDYIRLIIASKAARDGINLSNVVRGYLMSPLWNDAGMYQAISRFIRATSHQDLIDDLDEGENLQVQIYKLAAYVASRELGSDNILNDEGVIRDYDDKALMSFSNDLYVYGLSDNKDVVTRLKLEDIKLTAFDFLLNYNRNYSSDNKRRSKQTGYSARTPRPLTAFAPSIVKNTKRLLYHDDELDRLEAETRRLLTEYGIASLQQLRQMGIDPIYVSIFLQKRVPGMRIQDEFGGDKKVIYNNDCLYVKTDVHYMSIEPKRVEIVDNPVQVSLSEVEVFQTEVLGSDDMESTIRTKLEANFPDQSNQLLVQGLLENITIEIRNGNQNPKIAALYRLFEPYVDVVPYPTKAVDEATKLFNTGSSGPGREAKRFSSSKIKNSLSTLSKVETNDQMTYYHFFQPVMTRPSVTSIFSTVFTIPEPKRVVRILRRDKQTFEDANNNELPTFQLYYTTRIKEWMTSYIDRTQMNIKVIGSIYRDGNFRILAPARKMGSYTPGNMCSSLKPTQISNILNTEFYQQALRIMSSASGSVKRLHDDLTTQNQQTMETYLNERSISLTGDLREQYFKFRLQEGKSSKERCEYLTVYFSLTNTLIQTF